MSDPYYGEIRIWANTYNPRGWAYCNGDSLNIYSNQILYSVIGLNFGGNTTVFNLPDLRSRAPMGVGTGPGLTEKTFGLPCGSVSHTLTGVEMPAHTHAINTVLERSKYGVPDVTMYPGIASNSTASKVVNLYKTGTPPPSLVAMSPNSLTACGDGGSHENRQPFTAILYCIAIEGVFPVRPS
jgi:microcystin-dependent protein